MQVEDITLPDVDRQEDEVLRMLYHPPPLAAETAAERLLLSTPSESSSHQGWEAFLMPGSAGAAFGLDAYYGNLVGVTSYHNKFLCQRVFYQYQFGNLNCRRQTPIRS